MPFDLKALDGTAWLMEPGALRRAVARVAAVPTCPTARQLAKLRRKRLDEAAVLAGDARPSSGTDDPAERAANPAGGIRAVKGKVGVIPIHGPIQQRMTAELDKAGGTSCEYVSVALDSLLGNPAIGAIVLHVDSPGGGLYGTSELAEKIHAARGEKPIYAIADSMMCSAAYWIGTAAGSVICTPGGDVGSVGVYCCHVDESKALELEGLTVSMISAGKYKAELSPHQPLSKDARAFLQADVDATYDKFVKAVAKHRGISPGQVRADYGQGRTVQAADALEAGMVDRVMSFEQLLAKLTGAAPPSGGSKPSPNASLLRLKHEHRKRLGA